jgi:hypothetical protein
MAQLSNERLPNYQVSTLAEYLAGFDTRPAGRCHWQRRFRSGSLALPFSSTRVNVNGQVFKALYVLSMLCAVAQCNLKQLDHGRNGRCQAGTSRQCRQTSQELRQIGLSNIPLSELPDLMVRSEPKVSTL